MRIHIVLLSLSFIALFSGCICNQPACETTTLASTTTLAGPDCAPHFTRVTADEFPSCKNAFVDENAVNDAYVCKADDSYPANSCPEGGYMSTTYGDAVGSIPGYMCSIRQDPAQTSAPAGCPIADTKCSEGFRLDLPVSHLDWTGTGDTLACYYVCVADPDPRYSNLDWPCLKPGYKPIGGRGWGVPGGGETCCARWIQMRVIW